LRAEGFFSTPGLDAAAAEATGFGATDFGAADFGAAGFEAAGFEAAGFEAAARRDAGSAAATDGLSEQSVFGRGAGIGSPSASPPLKPAPTITAACRILAVRSRVLGDGATFQCTTLAL
jgi:hypothetical protein